MLLITATLLLFNRANISLEEIRKAINSLVKSLRDHMFPKLRKR